MIRALIVIGVIILLAAAPFLPIPIPIIFSDPLNAPGTLNLIGLCFVFGGLALTYDLVFGFTGLLSFGHALYFAIGVYVPAVLLAKLHFTLPQALLTTAAMAIIVPLLIGAVSLRVRDTQFAMVTLAFAQAGAVYVGQSALTGGEEGLSLGSDSLPAFLVGVTNTHNLYWIALAFLIVSYCAGWWVVNSPTGKVWQAIRENERRVAVLGLNPFFYKLSSFVIAGFMAAVAGFVYLLLQGGASPDVTTANFTLTLLVMVVLGGVGTLWGAVAGGIIYEYLNFRLVALSNSAGLQGLPAIIRVPASEPEFILGVLFILLVLFVPGGLAGLVRRHSAAVAAH
mgnify:CR=1 FL=1